jgi:hypothetical protein
MRTIPWPAPEGDFGLGAAEMFELAFRAEKRRETTAQFKDLLTDI